MSPDPRKPVKGKPAAAPISEDEDDLPPEPSKEGGMTSREEGEKLEAAEEEKRLAELKRQEADPISVGDEKLKAFKAEARKKIEESLIAKRKKRRLLRGGDVSK
jgi:hypothetical protein